MVSIVLITYNRAERLKLSIQDILDQTFKNFELIICDDCSTDSTEEVCRHFAAQDNRIRYFRQSANLQMPGNLNFGIKKSTCEYVAILHDGDRFRADLIEQWYNALSTHKSVGFVFNSIGLTDENDEIIHRYCEFGEGIVLKDHLLKKVFFRRWRFDSPVYGEAMVRKSLIEKYGYLHHQYGFYADVDLWMGLLHDHDAYYCADTIITGPVKAVQPQLFDISLIRIFLYMAGIQLKHRHHAHRTQPFRLIAELAVYWAQTLLCLTYYLLMIVKNFSFRSFIGAAGLLKRSVLFLIPWVIILFLYPVLYPFLKLYPVIKGMIQMKSPELAESR